MEAVRQKVEARSWKHLSLIPYTLYLIPPTLKLQFFQILPTRHKSAITEVIQHFADFFCRRGQIDIVAEFQKCGCFFDSWLFRIDFPRVHVKAVCTLFVQYPLDSLFEDTIGYQPEIAATGKREDNRLKD